METFRNGIRNTLGECWSAAWRLWAHAESDLNLEAVCVRIWLWLRHVCVRRKLMHDKGKEKWMDLGLVEVPGSIEVIWT